MKILQLRAENLKRLTVVEITPDGNIVQISGKNGQGKTSVLDAIWWALDGAQNIQKKPIRDGQEKASIMLDMGELVVERTFTAKANYLKVTNADGQAFQQPQKMLDALLGELSFDPLQFQRMSQSEQIKRLQDLAGVDGDKVSAANKLDYEERRDLNRDAKVARGKADAIVIDGETTGDPIDVVELSEEIIALERQNNELETAKQAADEMRIRIDKGEKLIRQLEADLHELDKAAMGAIQDVGPLKQKFANADAQNKAIANQQAKDSLTAEALTTEEAAAALTEKMAKRTKKFEKAVAKAELPIDGLSIDLELGVMFQGNPFDQASDAEQIRISTALAMSANPKIRVLRIRDGSLLDADSLAMVAKMADDQDYQIWIETVDATGNVGFMLEDGAIKV